MAKIGTMAKLKKRTNLIVAAVVIGLVLVAPLPALQPHLGHQPLGCLVVERAARQAQDGMDAAIAVPPLVLLEDALDQLALLRVFVRFREELQMVVVGAAGQPRDGEQAVQGKLPPQFRDYPRLFAFARSFARTKAFNFFKYSFSMRRRWFSAIKSSSCPGVSLRLPFSGPLARPRLSVIRPSSPSSR